ncbi:MAG: glycosyltransferase [Coleofasciculaceae cyanobacterium SM2_1_6]|nr:glycosyltransferase [Coleofasciculaceae cyanobacterium SM2_1_6]
MQQPCHQQLIVFTRYPEVGKNKTRLIPEIGADLATQLHQHLAASTLQQCRQLYLGQSANNFTKITVSFTGGDRALMADWLGADLDYQPQGAGDLGAKMLGALEQLWQPDNYFVLIGTDCPALDAQILQKSFQELAHHDLVLGEAADGGYYLIGLKKIIPQLFQGIAWGTETVFRETVTIAHRLSLKIGYLPVLRDIDRPADLTYLASLPNFSGILDDLRQKSQNPQKI